MVNNNLEQQIDALFISKYKSPVVGEHWSRLAIGDVVTLQRGYDLPKEKMNFGQYPVAGSTDTIAYHNDYTTEPPCIVMGRSGNIGRPRLYLEKCWAHNTTLFSKQFHGSNPYWVYSMLKGIDFSQFQGGSAVPTLNRNHVHSFEVDVPKRTIQEEFGSLVSPIYEMIRQNIAEMTKLSDLRDTLINQLMNGKLDVSEVEL